MGGKNSKHNNGKGMKYTIRITTGDKSGPGDEANVFVVLHDR